MRRTVRASPAMLLAGACCLAGAGCLAAAGCGGSGGTLTVSAAASLQRPFGEYARQLAPGTDVRYSFAGSDALAAQIEQGLRPDVFASANLQLPERLHREGLVSRPRAFATNRLVIAVRRSSPIASLSDLERGGLTLAVGTPSVPIGSYTEAVLARLPERARGQVRAEERDREPDVSGIVGKLLQGAVDAGIVYATDVAATAGQLRAIELPRSLEPEVEYGVAIVEGSRHLARARAFVAGLMTGRGHRDLVRDGFAPAPAG